MKNGAIAHTGWKVSMISFAWEYCFNIRLLETSVLLTSHTYTTSKVIPLILKNLESIF